MLSAVPNPPKPDADHVSHMSRAAPTPRRAHSASDGHAAATPHPSAVPAGQQPGTPHASSLTAPAPEPHQFPAELAEEAVKPSAVHVRAGAPTEPTGSSGNPGGAARRGLGGPASGALSLRLAARLLALRSSRRRRPNIWQPRPAQAPRPKGEGLKPGVPADSAAVLVGKGGVVAGSRTGSGPGYPSPQMVEWTLHLLRDSGQIASVRGPHPPHLFNGEIAVPFTGRRAVPAHRQSAPYGRTQRGCGPLGA